MLVTELLATVVFTFLLVSSVSVLVDRRRIGARPVEHLVRSFRRSGKAAGVSVAPGLYKRLSPEMIKEVAAAHGLRFDGEFTYDHRLRLQFSLAPARSEDESHDR